MANPITHEDTIAEYLVTHIEAESYDDGDLEPLGLVTIAKTRRKDWAKFILSAADDLNPRGYRALCPGLWVMILAVETEPDDVVGGFWRARHYFRILLLRDETGDDMPEQRAAEDRDLLCKVIMDHKHFGDYLATAGRTNAGEYSCIQIEEMDPDPEEAEVFAEVDPNLGVLAFDISAVTTTQQ